MTRSGVRALAALISALLLSTACAQIPTSGPVLQGDEVRATIDDPVIRVLPRPPAQGLDPEQIVTGFLAASASFEDDHAVARQFLTAEASETWNPTAGVVVFDDNQGLSLRRSGRNLDVTMRELARISADGSLEPRASRELTDRFELERVGGEWRIASLPDGLYLTRLDVARTYRSYDLYFLAPGQDRLVPDPVFVPVDRSGAATSLVRSLLNGPTRWLAPAVETSVPAETSLVVDSVPVENGVALVDLSENVLAASDIDRQRLSAQLVWTLTELPDVTGVQITVAGSPLQLPDAPLVQDEETWDTFNPNRLPDSATALLVREGMVRRVVDGRAVPLVGPLGNGEFLVRHPATSADGSTVAALSRDGTTALRQQPFLSAKVETVLRGRRLAAPSIDAIGSLWLVDRVDSGSQVWMQPPNGRLRQVRAPGLRNRFVVTLRVSLDGTRVAVVIRDRQGEGELLIGRVVQGGQVVQLQAFRPLEDTLTDVRDVTWQASDSLIALGRDRGSVLQPFTIGVDGIIDQVGGTSLQGIASVAAAPGLPLLASTVSTGIWQNTGLSWQPFLRGRDPAYPG
jgi:hypothetical protein